MKFPSGKIESGHTICGPNWLRQIEPESLLTLHERMIGREDYGGGPQGGIVYTIQYKLRYQDWTHKGEYELRLTRADRPFGDSKKERAWGVPVFDTDLDGEPIWGVSPQLTHIIEKDRCEPRRALCWMPLDTAQIVRDHFAKTRRVIQASITHAREDKKTKICYTQRDLTLGPPRLRIRDNVVIGADIRCRAGSRRLRKACYTPSGHWASPTYEYLAREWIENPEIDISHMFWEKREWRWK